MYVVLPARSVGDVNLTIMTPELASKLANLEANVGARQNVKGTEANIEPPFI
jgi:hypothetical protein